MKEKIKLLKRYIEFKRKYKDSVEIDEIELFAIESLLERNRELEEKGKLVNCIIEKFNEVLPEKVNKIYVEDLVITNKDGVLKLKPIQERRKSEVKKMKVMISQPMKGKTNEQIREERTKLVENLEKDGLEVVDTIVSEEPPKGSDEAIYYLSKSIEFISKVDIVYFMKGWENARGCKIENRICQEYGKQTMYNIYED